MATYRALIEGRNFLLSQDGKIARHGFYQTVFVGAADPTTAESEALNKVRSDATLKALTQNSTDDPPMLYVDSLYEMEGSEVPDNPRGRTYYLERQWWQFWK
jgi:hypothetical protein